MQRELEPRETTATYGRSYLVTLGVALASFGVAFLYLDGIDASHAWVFVAFLAGGIFLMLFGLFGPTGKMAAWAEVTARHEASLFIALLALPVYRVLSPFYRGR